MEVEIDESNAMHK